MIPQLQGLPDLAKSATPNGLLQRIAQQVDILKKIVNSLEVGEGLELDIDAFGTLRIKLTENAYGSGGRYTGYFAVSQDAEDEDKFHVNGGRPLINGFEAIVEEESFDWPSSESHLWLYAYISSEENQQGDQLFSVGAELVLCDVDDDDDENTGPTATGILVKSRKLIATIYENKAWHQEFITGSECNFVMLGDACE